MVVLVLREMPVPTLVRWANARGHLTSTLHLTDDKLKTLCGKTGQLLAPLNPKIGERCVKCLRAVDGRARIKRLT